MLTLLVFLVCAGIIWLAHFETGEMTSDRQPPLVKAASVPLKRSPEDPGGRAVAELGGVRDLLREQPAEAEEQLLPGPEQPVSPSDRDGADAPPGASDGGEDGNARDALEALVAEIQNEKPGNGTADADGASPETAIDVTELSEVEADQPAASGTASPVEDNQEPPAAETAAAAATPVFSASEDGRFRIQLAAVREEEDAKRAWNAFEQQLGSFITGLQPFFERAETSNGVFYRVQVGPFAETTEADRVCVELKKQNASCFVVSR